MHLIIDFNSVLPKDEPITFTSEIDLLVLSCTAFRNLNSFGIQDSLLPEMVTHEDVKLSSEIENHFKSKLVINELRGINLGKFKQDMKQFLYSDRKSILRDHLPMVASLPKLYNEDLQVRKITEDLNKTSKHKSNLSNISISIKHVGKLHRHHKDNHHIEYWFKDQNNDPYMIEIGSKNPLKSVWEKIISQSEVSIRGKSKFYDSDFQFHKIYDFFIE